MSSFIFLIPNKNFQHKIGSFKKPTKAGQKTAVSVEIPSVRFPGFSPGNLPKAAMEAPGFENFEAVFDDPSPSFGQVGELSWN